MNFSRNQLIILGSVGGIVLIFLLLIITGIGIRPERTRTALNVWGIDDPVFFETAIKAFTDDFPGVEIIYKEVEEENYEQYLIDSLAAGVGPDIFMFRSDWIGRHRNKIVSAPEKVLTIDQFQNIFPQVVIQDFVVDSKIYASPLFIDTLVLFYNKDLFDIRGIALPPNNWVSFQNTIRRGVGASFGGPSPRVARAGDILNALMMQFGADLRLQNKSFVVFGAGGTSAINTYTSVSSPAVDTYTGFAREQIGMIIDFQSAKSKINSLNPNLNFNVAPLPQFNTLTPVVPAKYYGLAVSHQSDSPLVAWEFINFITTNVRVAENYLIVSNRPPALRSLIQTYIGTPSHGVFASQALIARSWNMPHREEVLGIFNQMIQSILNRQTTRQQALLEAENKINNLIKSLD